MPNGNDEWSQYARPAAKDEWAQYARPATKPSTSLFEQGRQAFESKGGNVGMPGSFEGKPENIGEYVPQTIGNVASGVGNIAEGNVARGTHEILSGGMNALLPAAPFAAVAAPGSFALGAAGSYVGGKVGRKGAQLFRASPDVQDVAEDVGSIVGGSPALFKTPTARSLLVNPATGKARLPLRLIAPKRAEVISDIFKPPPPPVPPEPTPFPSATSSATPIGNAPLPAPGEQTPFPRVVKRSEIAAAQRAADRATKLQAKADEAAAEAAKSNPFAGATSSQTPIGNAKLPIPQGSPTTFPMVEQAPRRGSMAPPPAPEEAAPSQDLITRNKRLVKPGEQPTAADLKRAGDYTQIDTAQLQRLARFGDVIAKNELIRRQKLGLR